MVTDVESTPINLPENNRTKISKPLLAINSEAFMYWQPNMTSIENLISEARSARQPAWSLTVRGSVHINQSDFPILYPGLVALGFGMTANPQRTLDLNIGATLEYLKIVRAERSVIIRRTMKDEGILQVAAADEIPETHKPSNEKDMAYKLDVPNQLKSRLLPKIGRKAKRVAKSEIKASDEMWVHLTTTLDEMSIWGLDTSQSPVQEFAAPLRMQSSL